MLKTFTGVALAGVLAIGAVIASSQTANAHRRHHHHHGGVAAGVVGGLAAGAIIGSAFAPRYGYGYYGAPAYYGYAPAYYGGPVYYGRRCWTRRVIGPGGGVRRVRVCR
jgi:hypothetical protein